jgi:hypothetical protein
MHPSRKRIIQESPASEFCKLLKYKVVFAKPLFQRMDIRLHQRFFGRVSPCPGQS